MATNSNPHDTPAMRQFRHFKEKYPQCVLFFRMGDFYETFYDDAKLLHKVLGVTLTQRTEGIPMAGMPYHSVEGYLRRVIEAGYRVAVCDQMEEPSQAKGVIRREVTRVITPGTLMDESLLEEGRENPLAAVQIHHTGKASIAWAELSTGAFSLVTIVEADLADELSRIGPRELLVCQESGEKIPTQIALLADQIQCVTTDRPAWQFRQNEAIEMLCKQFRVASLDGFGLSENDLDLGVASAIVHYLLETQAPAGNHRPLAHLRPPRRLIRSNYLMIDQTSLRSLEIERTLRSGDIQGSLLGQLQHCATAMGKRTLRHWLCYPLCQRSPIQRRHDVVSALVENEPFVNKLQHVLTDIQDIERIIGRVAIDRATPRDIVALGTSAAQADQLTQLLANHPRMEDYHERLMTVTDCLVALADTIGRACVCNPPAHLREGGLIVDGFDAELDEFRLLQSDSHTWLAGYQQQLAQASGMTNLKIGFNKVFGYYIEVTAANKNKALPSWTRKQTLKNAERYTTDELKQFEGKALSARQRAVTRELELFKQLCIQAQDHLRSLSEFAGVVAELDVLVCFARQATQYHYVRPVMVEEPILDIQGGRHPVLDELLGERFVPNDLNLGSSCPDNGDSAVNCSDATLALITGPNMAGKSTYIRQAALLTLMAHAGSFIPADTAHIGVCDRIFTRIGASDELHAGHSTFMVEMMETANICHHASKSSLIILDEIGRGTSTLDGLSLAWAIAEYLAHRRSRTLFATHYHELTSLAQEFPNVTNLNVTVREWDDQVVFLHRIVSGATDRSYGIHVAKIAGLPEPVVRRADQLLGQLAVSQSSRNRAPTTSRSPDRPDSTGQQLPLFTEFLEHPALEQLKNTDVAHLSPMAAFDLLRNLCDLVQQAKT